MNELHNPGPSLTGTADLACIHTCPSCLRFLISGFHGNNKKYPAPVRVSTRIFLLLLRHSVSTTYLAIDDLCVVSAAQWHISNLQTPHRRPARKSKPLCLFERFPILIGLNQRGVSGSTFIMLFSGLDFASEQSLVCVITPPTPLLLFILSPLSSDGSCSSSSLGYRSIGIYTPVCCVVVVALAHRI